MITVSTSSFNKLESFSFLSKNIKNLLISIVTLMIIS